MKLELTLPDIVGYLPYGLYCWYGENIKAALMVGITDYQIPIFEVGRKPILRPISDLRVEITEQGYNEGKPFVPIVTMAKVAYNDVGDWGHPIYSGEVYQCSCNGIFYGFEPTDGSFIVCDQTGFPVFSPKQRDLFDLLHRLHFDYRGLIPAGLAVSVHDLKQNPYE